MASTKMLLVEITIFDDETGEVETRAIKTYQGNYGYEVRNFFERLGERFAKLIDPYDDV
jgi:hypothetical protein